MLQSILRQRDAIERICHRYGVSRLELFGSAARGDFDPDRSDVDFFFTFDGNPDRLADRFFGLQEDLEALLGCRVDLVSLKDVQNRHFMTVANRHRTTLYAA